MAVYGDKTNFSWIENGQRKDTNAWDDNQWQSFWKDQGLAPTAPPPPSVMAPSAAPSTPQPITNAQQVTGTQANVGQTNAQGAPTTVAQSFQQSLVNRLNPQTASTSSPGIAPAIQANNLAEQRGMERNRNLLAERAAANGTSNSGGFDTSLLGLSQDRAAREGQFAGNAVQQEQNRMDANQNSAMGLAGSLLTGQQGLDQQMALANLDAALRRRGLDTQASLGQGDLALRSRLGEGQLNLGLLSALLNNQQFGQSLNQNALQFGQSLNTNSILGLLGGL